MSKKIGVLAVGYNCADMLEERLRPWVQAKESDGFVISCVSASFKEYEHNILQNEPTRHKLSNFLQRGDINYLNIPDTQKTEAEARTLALTPLLEENCDYIWLLDLQDEYYSFNDIQKIKKYFLNDPCLVWLGVHFKNYVFDGTAWIDGFCPPRIFKVDAGGYVLKSFYWDNDAAYHGILTRDILKYTSFPSAKIPKSIAHVPHMTWLNNENSKKKVEYQLAHFGDCSYKWNSVSHCLEFNTDYYQKIGQPIPILNKD